METRRKSAFSSYSWDNDKHEKWVMNFANKLRGKGVDATIDKFEIQKGSIHLNKMMDENIKSRDYTIIILTQDYSRKADEFSGGVGFENQIILPLL